MDTTVNFLPYAGPLHGLYVDRNHLVFKWTGPGLILFSVSRRGNSASCHFAADKKGLRHLRTAIEQFADFVFYLFDWCKMLLAQVKKPSVERLVKRLGFKFIVRLNDIAVYARGKQWAG